MPTVDFYRSPQRRTDDFSPSVTTEPVQTRNGPSTTVTPESSFAPQPFTIPTRNNNPQVTQPAPAQPYTPPASAAAPNAKNAAGRGVTAEQYYRDYLANFKVNLKQSDPAGWDDLIKALAAEGYNYTLDSRPDGMHKALYKNGDPNQAIKILNGYDQPIWEPILNGGSAEGGAAAGSQGGTQDPNSELFINEVLSRIAQLRKPVDDPLAPLYQLIAMQRVQGLNGAPYTAGEDAALTAHYMNPLTQARDAEIQQNKERIGARGMAPTSGLLDELNRGTNASYQSGVAQSSNDLAVRAVDEKQRRQQEQLSVLSDLLGYGKSQRNEDDQRGQEIVSLAGQLTGMDDKRLAALLQASGSGDNAASSAQSGLLQQGQQQLQARLQASNNQADRDAAWGEFFGTVLNNLDKLF